MANFTKLAKKDEPKGERMAQATPEPMLSGSKRYKEQLEDIAKDREVDRAKKNEEPKKGTKAYEDRRERDYERDLKENPRK